jgi:hypothetical protein
MKEKSVLLNLTPHDVTLETSDGHWTTIPPSGMVARVAVEETIVSEVALDATSIPVVARTLGQVTGLPENDEACIVSNLVLEAVKAQQPWRRNVFAPDTFSAVVCDEAGRLVAVRRLVGVAS